MEIKVAFRLDANSKVGFGHIMRCIALAQAFEKQNIAPWFWYLILRPLKFSRYMLASTNCFQEKKMKFLRLKGWFRMKK